MSRFGFLTRKPGSEEKPVEPAGASENPLEMTLQRTPAAPAEPAPPRAANAA